MVVGIDSLASLSRRSGPFGLAALLALTAAGCCASRGTAYPQSFAATTGRIAVVGDTQRTLPVERLIGREQNDAERARLVAAIAGERPDLLVHLGDAVAVGSSAADWAYFDRLMAPVRDAGIAVLPVFGNHDYWGFRPIATAAFGSRFPSPGESRWYSRQHGGLRLVWLDSNRRKLSADDWARQRRWFEDELDDADRDPGTRAALVFCHHPPYTNSTATGDEADVQEAFLPAFFASRKAVAMVTGHAHAYERFERCRQDVRRVRRRGRPAGPAAPRRRRATPRPVSRPVAPAVPLPAARRRRPRDCGRREGLRQGRGSRAADRPLHDRVSLPDVREHPG
jgi:hypothetical protein